MEPDIIAFTLSNLHQVYCMQIVTTDSDKDGTFDQFCHQGENRQLEQLSAVDIMSGCDWWLVLAKDHCKCR